MLRRGEKVFLRPVELADLPTMLKWRNDGDLAKFIWPGVPTPTPVAKQREWFEQIHGDHDRKVFLICDITTEKPIGSVGVHDISWRSRTGDLGISIGEKDYWGQGYGSEALILFLEYCFRVLNLRRIALEVYEYNERAIKAYEKVGFQKEGLVRRSIFKDGRYVNEYFMGILKDEFYAKNPTLQRVGE